MIKTFVLMGLPGSGKGKQAEMLGEKTGFPIYSSGNEYRKMALGGGLIASKVAEILNAGGLQPAWLSSFLFQKSLLSLLPDEGMIFEGTGRKEPEARLFTEVCEWLGRDFRVLHLKISEAAMAERLRKRQGIENRQDDDPSVFQNRLKSFYEHTLPAIEYFRSIDKVIEIDGEPLPDVVFAELWRKISAL